MKVVKRSTPALGVFVPVRGSVDVALGAVGPEDGPDLLCFPPLIGGLPPWQRPVQLHTQDTHQMWVPEIIAGTLNTAATQTPYLH